jgi:hypothetical protein
MTPPFGGAGPGLDCRPVMLCYPCCIHQAAMTGQAFVGNRAKENGVCSCGRRSPLFEVKLIGIGRRLLDEDEPQPRRRFSVSPGKARPDMNAVALLLSALLIVVVLLLWN